MLLQYTLFALLTSAWAAKAGCKKAGLKLCQKQCVNIQTDPLHCGNCKTKCATTDRCFNGICKPPPACASADCYNDNLNHYWVVMCGARYTVQPTLGRRQNIEDIYACLKICDEMEACGAANFQRSTGDCNLTDNDSLFGGTPSDPDWDYAIANDLNCPATPEE